MAGPTGRRGKPVALSVISLPRGAYRTTSRLARPVHEPPQRPAERAEVEAPNRIRDGERRVPDENGDDDDVLDDEVVHPDELSGALNGVQLGLRGAPEAVVFVVAPAGQVRARPLVRLLRGLP